MKIRHSNLMRHSNRRCFTIVEVVIVAGLFSLIMAGILTVYLAGQRSWHSTSVQIMATRGAGLGMARMVFGLGTNGELREATGIGLNTNMNGVWSGGVFPPLAGASSHYVTQAVSRPNPSWRLVCTNFTGAVTWYDYNRAASNIVFWCEPGQITNRQLVADYVTDAGVIITNDGVIFKLAVTRQNGRFNASVTNTTFIRLRNKK